MAPRIGRFLFPLLAGLVLAGCGGTKVPAGLKVGGAGGHGGAIGGGTATGGGAATGSAPQTFEVSFPTSAIGNDMDLLFVIDDSSVIATMQQKLLSQMPVLFQILENLPGGSPNLHVAVVSSDLGAPGDSTALLGCTATGDGGQFQSRPRGTCTSATLASGSTFLSDVDGQRNFTYGIADAFACIGQLGASGCGFQQPLAAIARALGADGSPPPAANAGFLRSNALLGIFVLTNQDDCSAPADTTIFSLNGGQQSITNPDGPLTHYRCNGGPRGGHVCTDPATGQTLVPPLAPPSDATGGQPVLTLTGCRDNDTGSSALTPVDALVQGIKALKPDPDHQIVIAAVTATPTPYRVDWVPPYSSTPDGSGDLWPLVLHSCGTTTDGSFGDPAVRINQFVQAFQNGVLESICDTSYGQAFQGLATKLANLVPTPSCITPPTTLQRDSQGYPACTVVYQRTDETGQQTTVLTPNCSENGGTAPCWTLSSDVSCPSGGLMFSLDPDRAAANAASLTATMNCSLCQPGSTSGC